jgi:4-amino-4-deoxy-L-arabinose transferase-like glycosyltransferase
MNSTGLRSAAGSAERAALAALLVLSLGLLLAWSVVVPVFEAPDEPHHWQYARYLHDHGRLPLFGPEFVEANSPPLYYLLVAPLASVSELPPHHAWVDAEGRVRLGIPPRFYLRRPGDGGRYRPIRAARWATCLISVGAVLFTFLAAREATGRAGTGLLAGGIVAFLPQFSFRGMNVSNDALVATAGAACTCLVVRLVRRGFSWPLGLATGVALAAAFLSKINAVVLALTVAAALASGDGPWPTRARRLAGVLGVSVLLAAPWALRNVVLYGDPFASRAMLTAVAPLVDPKPLGSPYFREVFPDALGRSFVGMFGWLNVPLPEWAYRAFLALGVLAALGVLSRGWRRAAERRLLCVLATIPALALGVVIHINLTFSQPQGRYLFPALAAIAVLAALGLEALPGWSRGLTAVLLAAMAALNVGALLWVVRPAYRMGAEGRTTGSGGPLQGFAHSGLARAAPGSYRTTSHDPQVLFPADLWAGGDQALHLELVGQCAPAVVEGAVYFGIDGQFLAEERRLGFAWRADGAVAQVAVPVSAHPRWKGRVTLIRVDPFDGESAVRCLGSTVSLAGAWLGADPHQERPPRGSQRNR